MIRILLYNWKISVTLNSLQSVRVQIKPYFGSFTFYTRFQMCRFVSVILFFLAIETLFNPLVTGYKWIHVKPGNRMPGNARVLSPGLSTYIGRARHFDEILPAEVHNTSCAFIYTCSEIIKKNEFEILVDAEDCVESMNLQLTDIPENILRIGNRWNGEPIYIAIANALPYNHIGQVLLTSKRIINWKTAEGKDKPFTLACKNTNNWVDIRIEDLPKDAISGGKSDDNNDLFVARLKRDCDIIPGQLNSDLGIATAVHEHRAIHATACQVLVGDMEFYSWVSAQNGEIPDYAVVGARSKNNELMYVARINKTLGYIIHSEALRYEMAYEILVQNEE